MPPEPAVRAVTFWSESGGSRKTTFSINTAAELGRRGYDVLVVDMDPQPASLTAALGHKDEKTRAGEHLCDVLIDTGSSRLDELILEETHFDMVPAHEGLSQFDQVLIANNVRVPDKLLLSELRELRDEYDVFVVDAPAGLNKLADNALYATRNVIVPLELSPKGYDSIEGMMRSIEGIVENYQIEDPGFDISVLGLVPNSTTQSNVSEWVRDDLEADGYTIFPFEFGQRSIMQEAWYNRMDIYEYMESKEAGRVRDYQREHIEEVFGSLANAIVAGEVQQPAEAEEVPA